MYEAEQLEESIEELVSLNRPVICTEYMARGHGTTFQFSLPIFKKHNIGYKLGACRGEKPDPFDWHTIMERSERVQAEDFLLAEDACRSPIYGIMISCERTVRLSMRTSCFAERIYIDPIGLKYMTRFLILTFLMLSIAVSPYMLSAKAESLGNLAKFPPIRKTLTVSTSADGMCGWHH